ncbi:hypothetical protein SCBWM1_gp27 [Synechococcus phage S-CBWM1]|uniref:Uncharacterized protein n=1 Tax=Synechococcus phage S-CBWM1 TaxID=2053653 RepID=A0A3G1L3E8_9CAUD|nr:hypothetical protein HOU61_gp170 [Synechococcus phage S-CBWM1]ATW62711.1 hypothetical protein SCBWM1_gp27 [Synechococcus phage S-CBWM1]
MLSTNYRLRLESICERIVGHGEVTLTDMIWAEKLAKANLSAARILRQARRRAENPNMTEDSLDGFLNALDIGGTGSEAAGIRGFNSPDEIVNFFRREDTDGEGENNWRRRD